MEKDNQKAIIKYLSSRDDIYFFRSSSGAVKLQGGRFMRTGKAGCPDIVCCWKGKFLGFEVKDYGKKKDQSEIQKLTEDKIKSLGGLYFLVYDRDEVKEIFDNLEAKYLLW